MNRVREFRKKSKMRLIDLAMKANISATWLWFTENGYDKRVSKGIKERIAEALGCEYGTVFPGEAESEALQSDRD